MKRSLLTIAFAATALSLAGCATQSAAQHHAPTLVLHWASAAIIVELAAAGFVLHEVRVGGALRRMVPWLGSSRSTPGKEAT